jgi:hypothetical protein
MFPRMLLKGTPKQTYPALEVAFIWAVDSISRVYFFLVHTPTATTESVGVT